MTVPSDPNLTRQPSTLDPRVEIPDDAPKAQGHGDDEAADVKEAQESFKQAVEEEAERPEVGPRKPGDHAGSDDNQDENEVPSGNVEDVKAWVGDDPDRAKQALQAEQSGQNRSTLVTWLQERS